MVLPMGISIKGINDSKKLSVLKREELFVEIYQKASSVGIGIVGQDIIDDVNILEATYIAMREAVSRLEGAPELLLVDGSWHKNPRA